MKKCRKSSISNLGYGVHLARNEIWSDLRIGEVEPESPAENGGLRRGDIVLSINGQSIESLEFFAILSIIQHELQQDQIRFLVLDPQDAELVQRYDLTIDENHENCIRIETSPFQAMSKQNKLALSEQSNTFKAQSTEREPIVEISPEKFDDQVCIEEPTNVNSE